MSILRVFPERNSYTPDDPLAFVGAPPVLLPAGVTEIHVSCVFSWHLDRCKRIAKSCEKLYGLPVKLGGPAVGSPTDAFVPGMYIKQGITFTSRGCPNKCPWCLVPKIEGAHYELPIQPGNVIQDNNVLACSLAHFKEMCVMLSKQRQGADFRGGFEAARLTDEHVAMLRDIRIKVIFFASDHLKVTDHLKRAAEKLAWLKRDKLFCYALCGFWPEDTPEKAEKRLRELWGLGIMPFAPLFRGYDEVKKRTWSKEWRDLARRWSRPAIIKARMMAILED